jgi:hypothetical protein
MRSALEQRLADRLHDVGALLPDELDPPADLERRVARVGTRHKGRVFTVLSIAALLVVTLGTVAVVSQSSGGTRVDVRGRAVIDPLPAGTVMLDARQSYVVAVDAGGHQVATLVNVQRGTVIDAQLTSDHRWLWYLSVAGRAGKDCGEVVRADVNSGTSEIMARAVSFAISPDGTRLARATGDELEDGCVSLTHIDTRAHLVISDLRTGDRSTWVDQASPRASVFSQMRWSNDGRNVVTRVCGQSCESLVRFEVPNQLGGALRSYVITRSGFLGMRPPAAFGPGSALYVLTRNITQSWREHAQELLVYDGDTFEPTGNLLRVDWRWDLEEVVPTAAGVFVVGTPTDEHGRPTGLTGMFRVENGELVHVKDFDYGVMTPVFTAR